MLQPVVHNISTDNQPYFLQSPAWATAWQQANGGKHAIHFVKTANKKLGCFVYQYPYIFGTTFLFIPKFSVSSTFSQPDFTELCLNISKLAKHTKAVFVKWEPLDENLETVSMLQKQFSLQDICGSSRIQFLATIQIPLDLISNTACPTTSLEAANVYQQNLQFWKLRSSNVQRYTKKSCQYAWHISTAKTDENFEAFWQIHQQTAGLQGFASYPKKYYKSLFEQENSKIIILRDVDFIPQSVWFGWQSDDLLIYLYGGNTQFSRQMHGQYFIHLIAVQMAASCGILFYDLGGYDEDHGYSEFKQKYKGRLVQFGQPLDIIFKPKMYWLLQNLRRIRQVFK